MSTPIRIGYCLSLTGPVAGNSRSAQLAHEIWREDINRRGGLLGRPIELICYDDQADASRVPGLYKRLMDEDKVDLVIGGYWQPVPKMMFPGVQQFLNTYQTRAVVARVDPLGHYMAPLAYAQMQVIAQAVEATGGFDDAALSTFTREATFNTVMGDIKFGKNGEWAHPRVLQVQFQGISGHDIEQFRTGSRQIVVSPSSLASGGLRFPYAEALMAEQRG
jgi:ABC-type branched-subunit amino acid transport system substrate-binding protein